MIRAWRRQFVDTYAVDATFIPSDASQSDKTEVHGSRVLEADIQVGNVLVRWHCDGWPVATPRTAGETNLDEDALQPPRRPRRTTRTASGTRTVSPPRRFRPPARNDHLEGAQRRSTRNLIEQRHADQQSVDHWATGASTPSPWNYLPSVSQRVELDTTPSHAADNSADSGELNYRPGRYDERPATAFRHAPWVIELIIMKRDASESESSSSTRTSSTRTSSTESRRQRRSPAVTVWPLSDSRAGAFEAPLTIGERRFVMPATRYRPVLVPPAEEA